eukprot:Platyproteum_vivax@DN7576_c2_g2_i6.p1
MEINHQKIVATFLLRQGDHLMAKETLPKQLHKNHVCLNLQGVYLLLRLFRNLAVVEFWVFGFPNCHPILTIFCGLTFLAILQFDHWAHTFCNSITMAPLLSIIRKMGFRHRPHINNSIVFCGNYI